MFCSLISRASPFSPLLFFTVVFTLVSHTLGVTLGTPVASNNPFIFLGGRWDTTTYTSYWPGSNFKLRFTATLSALTVTLGPSTTPNLQASISLDYGAYSPITLQPGTNTINLSGLSSSALVHIVRIVTQRGLTQGNMQLQSIAFDSATTILPYRGGTVNLEFIGDESSIGNSTTTSQGEVTAWPHLVAETFKAERNIIAQSGICLTNIPCGGNTKGMSSQYWNLQDGNAATNPSWSASQYTAPIPTHIFLTLGNNDYGAGVSATAYTSTLTSFLGQLRSAYPTQAIFMIYDFHEYYNNADVEAENARGSDKNLFHIDSYQWVDFTNTTVYQNGALTNVGHQVIANQVVSYLVMTHSLPIPDIYPMRTN